MEKESSFAIYRADGDRPYSLIGAQLGKGAEVAVNG